VDDTDEKRLSAEAASTLRAAGARFAFVYGSRARRTHRPNSDLDVATYWGADAPPPFEVLLPSRVDLLVLDTAPLELAGRVAVDGVLLFDDDPAARVHWVATTRKIYFDELPRITRAHREFAESLRRG
jgi:predicted nucleotidyltransferase